MAKTSFMINSIYVEFFCQVLENEYGVVNQKARHVENEAGRYIINGNPVIIRTYDGYSTVIAGRLADELDSLYSKWLKAYYQSQEAQEVRDSADAP